MSTYSIWKFPLEINASQAVLMPKGSTILCAQFQRDKLCLWAMVDTEAALEERKIIIHGTGHFIEKTNTRYISTVQQLGGTFVWHVFEEIPINTLSAG